MFQWIGLITLNLKTISSNGSAIRWVLKFKIFNPFAGKKKLSSFCQIQNLIFFLVFDIRRR